ncbi:GumC family protein [Tsuneonella mangrovi]|uniref:GumC family protein n=1 Tax=Tsuneonella mangrovi TaxID=1982042 RepID=UPI000BA1CB6D|nr:Wzz/FepE/Etk N-terminal domain-containing protein [Tsuneonella mangrovi]
MNASQALVRAHDHGSDVARIDGLRREDDRLDLAETVNFFRRWYPLILGIALVTGLVGLGVSLLLPKTYRAEATVVLDKGTDAVNGAAPSPAGRAVVSNELVETQVEIITSRDMTIRVAKAIGLFDGKSPTQQQEIESTLRHNVAAYRSGESYALEITYDAHDPQQAARIVNEFAKQYSNWGLGEDQQRNREARATLEQRLGSLRDQAQQDTEALQQYRIRNNLLSTSGTSLTEQEISNYEQQVATARASAAEDTAMLNTALSQLRSGSTGDDVGAALNSPVISSLRDQESLAAADVADLSSRYGPNHPQLIRARSKLKEIQTQIQDEIGRVISNLRAKQEVSQQRLASLSGSLGNAKQKLSQNNAAMVGLSDLERKAAASQSIYETYLNSYKQLLASEGTEQPDAKVVTQATVPIEPISPNLKLNLALAMIIGLGLGLMASYVAEALDQGIRRSDEIEGAFGERFLGSIPLLDKSDSTSPHAIAEIQDNPKSVFAESFRALSAALTQFTTSNDKVVAITSALPGEGKTVISCCLAHTSAKLGYRTILIDCDLRRRGISKLLGVKAEQSGLVEVLSGAAPLEVKNISDDYVFCILPISPSDEEPEGLLTGEPFEQLIAQLRERFDRIILDLPPVLPIAATRKMAQVADSVIFAVKWRKTPKAAAKAALKRLPSDLVNVVGIVLNKIDMRRRAHFGENDPDYYYSQYSEYYS